MVPQFFFDYSDWCDGVLLDQYKNIYAHIEILTLECAYLVDAHGELQSIEIKFSFQFSIALIYTFGMFVLDIFCQYGPLETLLILVLWLNYGVLLIF